MEWVVDKILQRGVSIGKYNNDLTMCHIFHLLQHHGQCHTVDGEIGPRRLFNYGSTADPGSPSTSPQQLLPLPSLSPWMDTNLQVLQEPPAIKEGDFGSSETEREHHNLLGLGWIQDSTSTERERVKFSWAIGFWYCGFVGPWRGCPRA